MIFFMLAAVVIVLAVNFSWGFFREPEKVADTEAGATPVTGMNPGEQNAMPGLLKDMVDLANTAIAGRDSGTPADAIAGTTAEAGNTSSPDITTGSPDSVTGPTPLSQEPGAPYTPAPDTITGPTPQPGTEPVPSTPPDTVTGPTPAPAPGTTPAPPPDAITSPTPAPAPGPGPSPEPSNEPEEDEEPEEREADSVSLRSTRVPATASLAEPSSSVLLGNLAWLVRLSRLDVIPGFAVFIRTSLGLNPAGDECGVPGTWPPAPVALQPKGRAGSREAVSSI